MHRTEEETLRSLDVLTNESALPHPATPMNSRNSKCNRRDTTSSEVPSAYSFKSTVMAIKANKAFEGLKDKRLTVKGNTKSVITRPELGCQ